MVMKIDIDYPQVSVKPSVNMHTASSIRGFADAGLR
jgi:hypothetical protein